MTSEARGMMKRRGDSAGLDLIPQSAAVLWRCGVRERPSGETVNPDRRRGLAAELLMDDVAELDLPRLWLVAACWHIVEPAVLPFSGQVDPSETRRGQDQCQPSSTPRGAPLVDQ